MKSRIILFTFIVSGLTLLLLLLNTKTHDVPAHQSPQRPSQPCASAAAPCLALYNGNTLIAKFNDFRFCGRDCIVYKDMFSNDWRQYSGTYRLEWIGPTKTTLL